MSQLPAKYRLLKDLGDNGLAIPETLFLSEKDLLAKDYEAKVKTFLNSLKPSSSSYGAPSRQRTMRSNLSQDIFIVPKL
jgi:hypothetical protein